MRHNDGRPNYYQGQELLIWRLILVIKPRVKLTSLLNAFRPFYQVMQVCEQHRCSTRPNAGKKDRVYDTQGGYCTLTLARKEPPHLRSSHGCHDLNFSHGYDRRDVHFRPFLNIVVIGCVVF